MANPPDPDFSSFDSLPDGGGVSLAQTAEDAATGVAGAVSRFGEKNKGSSVSDAAAAASEVTNAGRTMAVNVAIAQQAAKDLRAAKTAWEKASEGARKADLDKADKAVTDARADLGKAAAAEEAQREKYTKATEDTSPEGKLNAVAQKSALDMAAAETAKAQKTVDEAVAAAQRLHAQNKAACEALRAAMQRVADSLKKVDGSTCPPGKSNVAGGSGVKNPGSGTETGSGATDGATPGGKASAGTPAAKPSGTPAATPGAKTPGSATPVTTTSGTTGSDADLIKAAAALSQGQQQPQAQQAQQQMPTMPTVPQQTAQAQQQPKAGEKSDLEKKAERNSQEIDKLLGVGGTSAAAAALGLGGSTPSPVTTPSQAPAGPTTQLRPAGTPITGAGLSGAPAVNQQLPTTGTSRTDLVTTQNNTEVGGRAPGTENRPFSAAPDGSAQTRTSSATDTSTGQGTGSRTGSAPVAGAPGLGGIPVGGVAAPAASGSRRGGDEERTRIEVYQNEEQYFLNGGDTRSETVDGGTIAQNKPTRDEDGPRRPGRAA